MAIAVSAWKTARPVRILSFTANSEHTVLSGKNATEKSKRNGRKQPLVVGEPQGSASQAIAVVCWRQNASGLLTALLFG